jgi:hypothetical protein
MNVCQILSSVHLADQRFAGDKAFTIYQHFSAACVEARYEAAPHPVALGMAVTNENFLAQRSNL